MKIAVEALGATVGPADGAGRYTLGLLGGLERRIDVASSVFVGPSMREAMSGLRGLAHVDVLPSGNRAQRLRAQHVTVPRASRRMGMDAVIYLGNYAPLVHGPPAVVVVQNLLLAVDDPAFGRAHHLYRHFALSRIARTAAVVVAVSRTLAEALERREPRLRGRTRVVRPPFNVADLLQATPPSLPDAPREYFLVLGRPWDYRDYPLALSGLAESRLPHSLVVVGEATHEEREALRREASRLELADRLVFAGMVKDQGELRAWYEGASALLATSRVEAFGYPVGEAMALGTPVVAVRRTAYPEIVGDAGILVEPRSSDLSGALRLVVRPDERARLVELGHSRVGTATWDGVTDDLIEICRTVVAPKD